MRKLNKLSISDGRVNPKPLEREMRTVIGTKLMTIRSMKPFFVWALLMIGGIHAFAASTGELEGRDRKWVTDKNEVGGFQTDLEFNELPVAILLNNVFIKSDIGIDLYKVEKKEFPYYYIKREHKPFIIRGVGKNGRDSIVLEKDASPDNPIEINGESYIFVQNLISSQKFDLVSLEEIKEEFCPDVTGPCLYMVNKFFITKDVESYKLDKNFVLKVEALPSSEIDFFKGKEPFTIIRVFTDTSSNRYVPRIR